MTRQSHSRGLRSFRVKMGLSRSSQATWSRRWMVLASSPVSSLMRLAARPVGAARNTRSPASFNRWIMAFRVVVLPVPGPPVRMRMPCSKAARIASFCLSAYRMPLSCSMAAIFSSAPPMALGVMDIIDFIRAAM